VLRRALPVYVQYRNEVRGHRALDGHPAMTRLTEQHRMAVPWVRDSLEQYARYPMMQKRVTPEGCLNLFRRQVYLDRALRDQVVTCYETVEGAEWTITTRSSPRTSTTMWRLRPRMRLPPS
jgi:hypothetical protein